MAYFSKVQAKNKQGYKWICVLEGPTNPVTGVRQQVSRRADTKNEALQRAQDAVNNLRSGIDIKKAKKTRFEEVATDFLETYSKSGVRSSTVRTRSKSVKILLHHFAKSNIDSIKLKDIQKMLITMDNNGYSHSSMNSTKITAGMIFNFAVVHGLRKDNPCEGSVIPIKESTVEEIENDILAEKYFERHELEEFLEKVQLFGKRGDLETFYLLAFSGMRPGELCALKWSDINFETYDVRITKTIYNPDNNMREYKLNPPKTKSSISTFDLDESIIEMLKSYKEKQVIRHQRYCQQADDYHNGKFIFCHDNGYPYVQKNIIDRMKRIMKKTSIKKHATPHILRHTHISLLTEVGVDLKTIMHRVGHGDSKTTLKIYTHVTERMKKSANEKVRIHFGKILDINQKQEM
ncbi:tyrosine-type recombinase/integrase [Paenibacillus sp. FSL R5-0636]|uniref:tyrosine-type recombinase/integrase n=1 Tax=Paenibacillus TaxID=44249 RepID=UPI00096F4662|nr:tyrosine-type recombinase/integrase [Paenibacillus odorifer]OMD05720.1 site-specific integrase [Paenibacillus odorifer]